MAAYARMKSLSAQKGPHCTGSVTSYIWRRSSYNRLLQIEHEPPGGNVQTCHEFQVENKMLVML